MIDFVDRNRTLMFLVFSISIILILFCLTSFGDLAINEHKITFTDGSVVVCKHISPSVGFTGCVLLETGQTIKYENSKIFSVEGYSKQRRPPNE